MGHDARTPRLRGLIRPVGPRSTETYWLRRICAVLVTTLVILVLILISGRGTGPVLPRPSPKSAVGPVVSHSSGHATRPVKGFVPCSAISDGAAPPDGRTPAVPPDSFISLSPDGCP